MIKNSIMKRICTLLSFLFLNVICYSQTIEVLKFNANESQLKLSNGELVSIPLKDNLRFEGNEIVIKDKSVYNKNQKIAKYSKSKLKLTDGTTMFFWRKENEVFLGNGKRQSKHEFYAKATLQFNEDFNYLESITINEMNFENKALIESWLAFNTIDYLIAKPSSSSDDYMIGYLIGTIAGKN